MKSILKFKPLRIMSLIFVLSTGLLATKQFVIDTAKMVNIAGTQQLLSQKIAKEYLYVGKKINASRAERDLKKSIVLLKQQHKLLLTSINDEEIINLLDFVKMGTEDLEDTILQSFSIDNAQLIIDLSESMLEGSEYVLNSLKLKAYAKEVKIIEIASKQRMLAQRIAKYYIAYQSGIRDKNTVQQMKKAVSNFSKLQKGLLKIDINTPQINKKLNKIDRLWKIVYKFYLNIEKGGLPLIVFNTTNEISKEMNKVINLYIDLYK